jgi:hypothetical protein
MPDFIKSLDAVSRRTASCVSLWKLWITYYPKRLKSVGFFLAAAIHPAIAVGL